MPTSMPASATDDSELFVERVRLGMWIIVAATLVFAVADFFFRRQQLLAIYALKAAHLSAIVLVYRLVLRKPPRHVAEALVLAGLAAEIVSTALQGYLVGDGHVLPLSGLAMLLLAAVLLPWALRAQFALGTVVLAVVGTQWWSLRQGDGYLLVAVVVVVGVSMIVARETGRSRRAAAEAGEQILWHKRVLEEFLENAHDLIQWADADGRLVYVNQSWRRAMGYGAAEVSSLRVDDVVAPESREEWRQACASVAAGDAAHQVVRASLRARDGTFVMVDGHIQASNEDGAQVCAILRDVTETHVAEAARRETQVFLRSVLSALPSLVITVSPEGDILFLNRTVEGYTREGSLGQSIFEFLAPSSHADVRKALERAVVFREVVEFEAEGAGANGTIAVYRSRMAPIEQGGEVKAIALIATDVTEPRRAEEQRRRDAAASAALVRVGRVLIAATEESSMLRELCRVTTEVFACDTSHTFLVQEDGAYRAVAGHGDSAELWEVLRTTRIPELLVEPIVRRLDKDGIFQVAEDATPNDPAMAMARRFRITAAVYMPLRRGSRLVGVHTIAFRGRTSPVEPWVAELAREVGELVSLRLGRSDAVAGAGGAGGAKSGVDNPRRPC